MSRSVRGLRGANLAARDLEEGRSQRRIWHDIWREEDHDTQKQALEEIAGATRRTEAQLIRDGVDHVIESNRRSRRKPRPLFALDDPVLDDPQRVDEALEGFGE